MGQILPEIVAMGGFDAALVWKSTGRTHPRQVHLYEIEGILEDGGVSHVNGADYPIRAGNILIAKPGQRRQTTLPFKCLYLHLLVADEGLQTLLDATPSVYTPSTPAVMDAFRRLLAAYTAPQVDGGLGVASALCGLLSQLVHDTRLVAGTACLGEKHTGCIQEALAYIEANLDQPLTLSQIADRVYLSRIYFHRLFLAATGRTPYRYLLERRLALAKQQLLTTDRSVGVIARECGFSSQSYFNQVFRRELGCTPKGYRDQMSRQY